MTTPTTTPTHILGAGWAGMIAAARWHAAALCERDSHATELSGTTGAFIRCATPAPAHALQAPLRTVTVHRAVATSTWDTHTHVQPLDAALYSRKVTPRGALSARSIGELRSRRRYLLLPDDLVAARQRADGRVRYGSTDRSTAAVLNGATPAAPVVSTLPLEWTLRHLCADFRAPLLPERTCTREGLVLEAELLHCDPDFCWTVYVPSSATAISRVTITGCRAVVEVMFGDATTDIDTTDIEVSATHALWALFNVPPEDIVRWCWHRTHKFASTPEYVEWAREVVYRLSVERGIYSLGRAATGRRGVLIDDLLQDCRVIDALIRARNARDYSSALVTAREATQ